MNEIARVRATVSKIVVGKKPFVVTRPEDASILGNSGGSITFGLNAWSGTERPHVGQLVQLEAIQLFAGGWRAMHAHPITFEQQQ